MQVFFNCLYKALWPSQATQALKTPSKRLFFPHHRFHMSIQLQVYRSRAERWNVTTNYLSRLPCSTQYWGVGIFPKEFYWSAYTINFPSPNFYFWRWLLMQLLPPQHRYQRIPSRQPNTSASEVNREKRLSSTFERKKAREGERRGKCLNLGIYLLKHRKNTHTGTTLAEIPAVRAVELCFQPAFASSFTRVFSLSHTHTEAYWRSLWTANQSVCQV